MKQVFSVTIETTEGKHRGNANMFTWQWGQVFAQGHMVTAGLITMHINCKTLLTGSICTQISLQPPQYPFSMFTSPQNNI